MKLTSSNISFLVVGVALFALGFIVAHSTIATPKCTSGVECYDVPVHAPVVQGPEQPNSANQMFLGHSLSDWVITWYKWMLPQYPTATYDQSGYLTMKYQPANSPIYFLAEEHNAVAPNRHIVMHQMPLMFPALNTLVVSYNPVSEDSFLKAADGIVAGEEPHSTSVSVDGKLVNVIHIKTPIFGMHTYGYDAAIGNYHEGDALCTSQGYWVFLNPLSVGNHTVQFFGGSRDYVAGATYHIQVYQ